MSKTAQGLVDHARTQMGLPYWWGTFGQVATLDLLNQKAKQYPEQYSAARQATAKAKHMGKRVYDCAGLVKSYWMQENPTATAKYIEKYDKNVGGLRDSSSVKGDITNIPETPGTLVFRKREHVGIYIGGGRVVEAKGFDHGVVETALKSGGWDTWGKLDWLEYGMSPAPAANSGGGIFMAEKTFKNTSGKEINVCADSAMTVKVGSLFDGSTCSCIGKVGDNAILFYKVVPTGVYKVGFTDYVKGIQ
ncbi:MAG: C40 family peptidase [Oscillospiraceae bacterium]|nr:C40 family peptidase [Oscillospiraceae bacterium]